MTYLPRTPEARLYRLMRDGEGVLRVSRVPREGRERPLTHMAFHSAEGFECGYSNSGSANLALSIAADLFKASKAPADYRFWGQMKGPESDALRVHQALKWRFITGLQIEPNGSADLDAAELYAFVLEERARFRGTDPAAHR